MTKTTVGIFIFFMVLFHACNWFDSSPPGYSKNKHGVYYKLLKIGEESTKPEIGDMITAKLKYYTTDDSLFFEGTRKFRLNKPAYPGSIDDCFKQLSKGDKARFIIDGHRFFEETLQSSVPDFLIDKQNMIAEIEMLSIQSAESYHQEKEAFLKWINDFGEYEKTLLKQYIEKQEINVEPSASGLYHIVIREGKGNKVTKGDTIIFHYEGRFLNGKFFDSSHQRNEPFGFVYGQEWQVIPGLEEGLGQMREGEKAIFIIPSELAFGATGSSTSIIPPYTSLIFEVELLEVK